MGKAGRFACIFVPMALTIASLICLGLVFSGQTNQHMKIPRDLYFFKANTQRFQADPSIKVPDVPNTNLDNKLLEALQGAASHTELKDFYKVGLWNYCEGDINDKGEETITKCSPRKTNFWFNPIEVWDLEGTAAQKIFDDEFKTGVNALNTVAKWMFTAYVIAAALTGAEIIVGIFAIFSRWGSLATTVLSTASTIFVLAAAGTSTAVYASLAGVFHSLLKPYKIDASLGGQMLTVSWLGAAFSVASGFFWLISVCCCSGKSGHKKVVVEKSPYTYERVASPYLGARESSHGAPTSGHGTSGSAYEPFRHERV